MKRTLLTTAILFGISGSALAATDGFVVESSVHPEHDGAQTSEHTVWVEKVADGKHTYELRIEDGVITVVVDGDKVPDKQIKKDNNAVVILKDDGGVLYEFELALTTDSKHAKHVKHDGKHTIFVTEDGGDVTFDFIGDKNENMVFVGEKQHPKVMLGIYSDEPGESLRKQLGIKGKAIIVESVIKGLSADKAGMKDHDIIISIDGSDGVSPEDLTKILGKHNPGDEIKIVVIRNGEKIKLGTKLHAYDGHALGHVVDITEDGGQWATLDRLPGNVRTAPQANRFFFSPEAQEKTHAKILDALRNQGIDQNQIDEIEAKIIASLDENVWSAFGEDGAMKFEFRTDDHASQMDNDKQHFLAERMRMKAEQAMQDAERMTMEFKDGQLLLKRHVEGLNEQLNERLHELEGFEGLEGLEGKLHEMAEKLHESMPEIEEELEGRLGELEERLNELESMLDSRMESLTGLIEKLIERLDED